METLTLEEYNALSRAELVKLNHAQYGTVGGWDALLDAHLPGRSVVTDAEDEVVAAAERVA